MTVCVVDLLKEVNAIAKLDVKGKVKPFSYQDEEIAFKDDVHFEGQIKRMQSKYYLVTGTVTAVLVLQCGLCLEKYDFKTSFPVELHFMSKEKAIDDDVDVYYTDGDNVELDEAIQTNAIMNIPSKRLCSPDCKGLCPVCGKKLGDKCCDCGSKEEVENDSIDARLAVLRGFFDK